MALRSAIHRKTISTPSKRGFNEAEGRTPPLSVKHCVGYFSVVSSGHADRCLAICNIVHCHASHNSLLLSYLSAFPSLFHTIWTSQFNTASFIWHRPANSLSPPLFRRSRERSILSFHLYLFPGEWLYCADPIQICICNRLFVQQR